MNNRGKSIASMACGIAGLVLAFGGYSGVLGIAASIVGLILSKQAVAEGGTNNFNKAGKITSMIGIIFSIVGLVIAIACVACGACEGQCPVGAISMWSCIRIRNE